MPIKQKVFVLAAVVALVALTAIGWRWTTRRPGVDLRQKTGPERVLQGRDSQALSATQPSGTSAEGASAEESLAISAFAVPNETAGSTLALPQMSALRAERDRLRAEAEKAEPNTIAAVIGDLRWRMYESFPIVYDQVIFSVEDGRRVEVERGTVTRVTPRLLRLDKEEANGVRGTFIVNDQTRIFKHEGETGQMWLDPQTPGILHKAVFEVAYKQMNAAGGANASSESIVGKSPDRECTALTDGDRWVLWIDRQNHLPVRIELKAKDDPEKTTVVEMEHVSVGEHGFFPKVMHVWELKDKQVTSEKVTEVIGDIRFAVDLQPGYFQVPAVEGFIDRVPTLED